MKTRKRKSQGKDEGSISFMKTKRQLLVEIEILCTMTLMIAAGEL